MRLSRASEVCPDESGLLCRQSRLWASLATTLMCLVLAGIPVMWWQLGAPWPVWGGCTLLALFIVPMLIRALLLRLRASNWLMWIRPDGLRINFRSYQDVSAPDEAAAVVHLEFSEIARVQRLSESYSTPVGHGHSSVRHRELALLVHLVKADGSVLQEALAAERSREPEERVLLGFIRVASKPSHFAVTMPSLNVIRIAWRGGHGNHVVPALGEVLIHFERFAAIADQQRRDRVDWHEMDDDEIDQLIRHLVESGATIDASRLLVKAKGYTTTEAHNYISELAQQS